MRYSTVRFDHVRWRSDALRGEIAVPPSMGKFIEFMGKETAHLGWHFDDEKSGDHISIELDRSEAEQLYRLLGDRLGVVVTQRYR